jgi:hypothetical protein
MMTGEGAGRAGWFGSKRRSDCGNVRTFGDGGNGEPRRQRISYQLFFGTEREMTDPEQGGSRRGAIAGLAIAVAILALGLWLAHDLTAASKMQDCLMSGRTNCNVIPAQ